MPTPYSIDLRWRVVWFHLVHGFTSQEVADLLCLSERTVRRYITLFHQTGDIKPVSRRSRPQRLLGDLEQVYLFQLILRNPGIYLHELQHRLQEAYGVRVHVSTICRTLKSMGCTRQVIRHVALQQSEAMRAKFMAEVSIYDPSMLVWIDESGCDRRNSIRKYGYSVRGIRPVDHRILVRGTRYSAVPVMSVQGIHDVFLAEGSINGDRFEFFIRNFLLPVMMPFNGINPLSVVILDNASIHHVESNVNLIESMGVKVIFLPPYSPDLNPLEPVFGKIKAILKENDSIFQVTSAPRVFLAMAFTMVTHEDCLNFSRHCGYY